MKKKVAIINFGMGNLNSVQVILNYLAIKNDILENPQNINNYSHIVLPGVGSFKKAVKNLKKMVFLILCFKFQKIKIKKF